MPNDHDIWQWQEPGTAWKGVGLYHITLTIPSREALLGELVIPENDPKRAYIKYSDLGRALLDIQRAFPTYHPEIQVLHYCLMPDHLHMVWYVRRQMKRGIKSAVQGFWLAAKKIGRAYSYYTPTDSREQFKENGKPHLTNGTTEENIYPTDSREQGKENGKPHLTDGTTEENIYSTVSRENYQENSLRNVLGDAAYYALSPIFTELPFIRPMGQYRQLPATNQYVDMNPQRLATKRLKPGFFRVQDNIEIAGRIYKGVGNTKILQHTSFAPVHVHHELLNLAAAGNNQPLRDYMNGCVIAARQGAVMVSPFISEKEKEVLVVLLAEGHDLIFLTDNGFRDYYKPSDGLFDSVEAGHVLILSPWPYDPKKRRVSRDECVAMNGMAEEICDSLSSIASTDSRDNTKKNTN